MKIRFKEKQNKEKSKLLKQKEDLKAQMKKFAVKKEKFKKEMAAFKKELAKFEKAKNIGITKDLIKNIKVKLVNQKEIVKKHQTNFDQAKKKTDEAYKEYKKLRGSIFNRNYKNLKKLYKLALADQKIKSKDLKSEQNKMEKLEDELRDARNRLRVASSN